MPKTKTDKANAMTTEKLTCLINASDCGREAGSPVCPKCGMDERVVYPGRADLEVAIAQARVNYQNSIRVNEASSQIGAGQPSIARGDYLIKPQKLKHIPAKIFLFRNTYYEHPLYKGVYTLVVSSQGEEVAKGFLVSHVDYLNKCHISLGALVDVEKIAEFDANIFVWVHLFGSEFLSRSRPVSDFLEGTNRNITDQDKERFVVQVTELVGAFKPSDRRYQRFLKTSSIIFFFEYIFFGALTNLYHVIATFKPVASIRRSLIRDFGVNKFGIIPFGESSQSVPSGVCRPIFRDELRAKFESALDLEALYKACGNRLPHFVMPIGCNTNESMSSATLIGVDFDPIAVLACLASLGFDSVDALLSVTCTDASAIDSETLQYEALIEMRKRLDEEGK